jgi:thiol:disulfide interchange protein DsbD
VISTHSFRRWAGSTALAVVAGLALGAAAAHAADDFLDPDQAFQLKAERRADGAVALHWQIAEGYTLYKARLHLRADGRELVARLPAAERKPDPASGDVVEVFHRRLDAEVAVAATARTIEIEYQGCADAGLCYPPQRRHASLAGNLDAAKSGGQKATRLALLDGEVDVGAAAAGGTADAGAVTQLSLADLAPAVVTNPAGKAAVAPGSAISVTPAVSNDRAGNAVFDAAAIAKAETNAEAKADAALASEGAGQRAGRVLRSGNLFEVMATFLVFGLLLSLTPCVLPMVPILSAIIVGQQVTTRRRGLQLASAYALGMALVYTALGVAAGLAGEGLAGYLQQPAVLIAFALLLAGLSLSMFDVYTLQVPSSLMTRISGLSDRVGGGAVGAAAALGALSALMVGPCVAAPLAGALLYIGQSHDVVLGGLALFALACGMSVPLLLAGASAGSLLPRAGAWMNRVKHVFGLLLLAVSWWMVSPLVASSAVLAGWGVLALAAAVFLGLCEPLPASVGALPRALRSGVIALALLGVLEIVGSVSGADDALAPLARLAQRGGGIQTAAAATAPRFVTVASAAELDRAVASSAKPVMLDFYADWCTSCKEMERETFADPQVAQAMAGFTLLRADVTTNSPQQRDLLKRFGLFGPPGLVFFDTVGRELGAARLVGFAAPGAFRAHLGRVAGR